MLKTSVRAHALWYFFPLAFLLSWYPWLLSFFGVRAAGINPLGVLVAALIVSVGAGGWAGLKAVLLRIVRVNVGIQWYLAALLVPAVFAFVSLAVNLALGAPMPGHEQWGKWPAIVDHFIFGFFFVGLGEEPGWRGYALPELQRRRSPLAAALLLDATWALWHVPLWGTEFPWSVVPAFFVSVLAGSVFSAWLFNSARETCSCAWCSTPASIPSALDTYFRCLRARIRCDSGGFTPSSGLPAQFSSCGWRVVH